LGSPPIAYHGLERHHAADHLQRPDFLRVRLTHVDGHRRSFFPTDQIDHLPDAHAVGLDTVHGDDQVVALHAGLVGWTGAKGEADLCEFFLLVEGDLNTGADVPVGRRLIHDFRLRGVDEVRSARHAAGQSLEYQFLALHREPRLAGTVHRPDLPE